MSNNSDLPLMPKATAVWLIDNTALTFEQIGNFCGMHYLEIQSIADGDSGNGIVGIDPISTKQLEEKEIKACEKDSSRDLKLSKESRKHLQKKKGAGYTPIARRQDKPDAIAWIIKNHPYMSDGQIIKLIGTTKKTIESIRTKEHWNSTNIRPRDPVLLGLCSQLELNKAIDKSQKNAPQKQEEIASENAILDIESDITENNNEQDLPYN